MIQGSDGNTVISIHAPREGSDFPDGADALTSGISIHAPREGSDNAPVILSLSTDDFNPRSP